MSDENNDRKPDTGSTTRRGIMNEDQTRRTPPKPIIRKVEKPKNSDD